MVAPKRCVYCKGDVPEDRAMDVCDRCGRGVWGEKMFKTILENTNSEKAKGNMELGRVSENVVQTSNAGDIQEMHKMLGESRRVR